MRTHTGARLLLADDDSVTLQACADALVLEGFEVRTAIDGYSALTVILSWQPDIALLDIEIPYAVLQGRPSNGRVIL